MVLHLHTLPCHRCGTVTPHVADKPNHALHLGLTLLFTMFLGIAGAFAWGIVWFVLLFQPTPVYCLRCGTHPDPRGAAPAPYGPQPKEGTPVRVLPGGRPRA